MKKYNMIGLIPYLLVVVVLLLSVNSFAGTPRQIYQKSGPGVVFIFASEGTSSGKGGTGSIIRDDGLVITNAHIFTDGKSTKLFSNISVFLKPPRVTGDPKKDLARRYKGKMVAYDLDLDLALVKMMSVKEDLSPIFFTDSRDVVIGDQVFAIGHPEQGGLWSLTTGVISAFWNDYGGIRGKHLFQTDASINRGNSGGPLLDGDGDMVGINSMIARKAADGLTITDVNFSIRSKVAIKWLNQKGFSFDAKRKEMASMDTTPPKETPEAESTQTQPKKEDKGTKVAEQSQSEQEATPVEKQVEQQEESKPVEKKEIPKPVDEEPQKKVTEPEIQPDPEPIEDKILTEKIPYNLDELIEGMQEMEDLMDEMKDFMNEFKKKRG